MALHPAMAGLQDQAYQAGINDGGAQGYQQGAQEGYGIGLQHGSQQRPIANRMSDKIVAGLMPQQAMQQDGQNFGDPQAQAMMQQAGQVADGIMAGQIDPNQVAQAAKQGDPVAANAMQILQEEQARQQNEVAAAGMQQPA